MSVGIDRWRARAATLAAMGSLVRAVATVRLSAWPRWRDRLGLADGQVNGALAHRRARVIERAAWRMPRAPKCLAQAVALSRRLRREGLSHEVVLAVRPAGRRGGADALHAWVEAEGEIVLGALPGPWIEVARLPSSSPPPR